MRSSFRSESRNELKGVSSPVNDRKGLRRLWSPRRTVIGKKKKTRKKKLFFSRRTEEKD